MATVDTASDTSIICQAYAANLQRDMPGHVRGIHTWRLWKTRMTSRCRYTDGQKHVVSVQWQRLFSDSLDYTLPLWNCPGNVRLSSFLCNCFNHIHSLPGTCTEPVRGTHTWHLWKTTMTFRCRYTDWQKHVVSVQWQRFFADLLDYTLPVWNLRSPLAMTAAKLSW